MPSIGSEVVATSGLTATTLFVYLIVPALVLWFAYYRMSRRRLYELADKIPGPKGLPLIGVAHEAFGRSPHGLFKRALEVEEKFLDTVVKIWFGPRLIILLKDPRDVEIILSSHVHIDKSPEYRFFKPWLGNGLLISTGEKWRAHRKLIAPTFHLNVLKSFLDLFNQNSRAVVEKMRKHNGEAFDCHDYMSECTVEILLETAMGVNKKTQNQSGFEYAMAVMKMCHILHIRSTKVWLRPDFLFNLTSHAKDQARLLNIIHTLTKQVLKKKKETYEKNKSAILNSIPMPTVGIKEEKKAEEKVKDKTVVEGLSYGQSSGLKDDLDVDEDVGEKKRLAFLDLLIESAQNGVVLTDEEIKEQVDTIMFEGHDTTAAGSSFFLCVMGTHPEIQAKVIQEIDEIFGDSDRPCTFQDTLEMKYLERCIMETLRMFPPVPIIARELQQEVKLNSCDLSIPAKCTVVIATVKLHRQPDTYPNPDVYNPDNFLPENCANRHYYSFVPFSAGPRSCVGRKYAMLKLKVILSTILRNFTVHSPTKLEDWKLQADIILKRTDGFKIQLKPRKKQTVA
uniref:Cytochrome P450 CYP4g15-2 n=1 Tax=Diaphorina citri TaxID=121845 RepID=A0A482LN23_DIACI|nr:cytochrome P450 CYP4g15-2 [Diaphorina citri]